MRRRMRPGKLVSILVVLLCACSESPEAAEPGDVDLRVLRRSFGCGTASADADACTTIEAFAQAHAISQWPDAGEELRFVGIDRCADPTAADGTAYQLVYLRPDPPGSEPREVPYRFALGPLTPGRDAPESQRAALDALARGRHTSVAVRDLPVDATWDPSVFRPLVRAPSGISVTDELSIWYLRMKGDRLYVVSPTVQLGCASELHRVPPG